MDYEYKFRLAVIDKRTSIYIRALIDRMPEFDVVMTEDEFAAMKAALNVIGLTVKGVGKRMYVDYEEIIA